VTSYANPEASYKGCYSNHQESPPGNAAALLRLRDDADYASNGQFSLSFWFTHNHCENLAATGPDGWEPLYHHGGEECATCPWQSIGVFIACNSSLIMDRGRSTETVSNINSLMVYMVDDDGQMAEVSVPFTMDDSRDATGSEDHLGAADGRALSHWIHFGLSVNRDKMTIYIDGVPAREFGTDKAVEGFGMTNLAAGHLSSWALRRSDGEITLDAPLGDISLADVPGAGPFLGHYHGGSVQPAFFNGYIAQVGIFSRAIDKSEMSCLYKYGETHLGLPPPDSGL